MKCLCYLSWGETHTQCPIHGLDKITSGKVKECKHEWHEPYLTNHGKACKKCGMNLMDYGKVKESE